MFEAPSIASLDFDRTEANTGSGSGVVPSTPLIPLDKPIPDPFNNKELYFSDLDSGSFTDIRFCGHCKKEITHIRVAINFTSGKHHSSLASAEIVQAPKDSMVSAHLTTGPLFIMLDYTLNTVNSEGEFEIVIKTTWNHDDIGGLYATIGGYDGINEQDYPPSHVNRNLFTSEWATVMIMAE